MKIKNIMFTGFMAAILGASGAVAADTPVSVASTGYVDSVVEKNVTEVSFADDNTTYLKEATGELNMTVVTIVAIGAIVAFFYLLIWPTIQTNMALTTACNAAGYSEYKTTGTNNGKQY